jgi:tRNA threonylcarbamoyladenosine modification (KEOPS) complex Cgi121 subunit
VDTRLVLEDDVRGFLFWFGELQDDLLEEEFLEFGLQVEEGGVLGEQGVGELVKGQFGVEEELVGLVVDLQVYWD